MSKNWAICIGINEYKFVGELNYARRDAQLMAEFCKQELRFEKVFYFAEGAPDVETVPARGQVIEASPRFGNLDMFLHAQFEQRNFLNPQDNLWFFFAGHGMRADGIDYLMPIDGNPRRIERTGLKIHDLAERLRRCGAGNIVLMLDACRSGDSRDIGLEEGIGVEPQQGMVTLFSCGPNEKSYEIDEEQQGAFTFALLEGLKINEPNNCATVDRLSRYVKQRVTELNKPSNRQTVSVKAEPIEKLHLVLLPDKATVRDVDPLKKAALNAEVLGELALARQLWIRVLAIIRADLEAVEAIERIAVKRAKLPQMAKTLGIDGERVDVANQRTADQKVEIDQKIKSATEEPSVSPALPTFTFEVVTVDRKGEIAERVQRSAAYRTENINGVELELVFVPSGEFVMGSPPNEVGRDAYGDSLKGVDVEGPQHRVSLQSFFMGKYPVTQAQWRAVAALPKVERELEAEPSYFKGDRLPVEQVSWHDAVEFCQRLSNHKNKAYRLPSEAEWEYACRAGTNTPFHFGETLSANIANYNATYAYDSGLKGNYRKRPTEVGSFLANAFGLYDLHGNVREWCLGYWHDSYVGAPADGSAWLKDGNSSSRITRGGSWDSYPRYCRSAYRFNISPGFRGSNIGFRVSCAAPRT